MTSGSLKLKEELLCFLGSICLHIGRQQALPIPQLGVCDRVVDTFQIEQTSVSFYLGIKRRLAINEYDRSSRQPGDCQEARRDGDIAKHLPSNWP